MNDYEQRQEARRARLEAAAAKAAHESDARYQASNRILDPIPLGQPILVGHHSERRHRRDLARAGAAMRQAIDADAKAKRLLARAAAVGTGGISSDDPEAVAKLTAEVERREQLQARMRAANAAIRQGGTDDEKIARLVALGFKETTARTALLPDFAGRVGFPAYALTNNSAQVRRIKARLADLERAATETTTEVQIGAVRIVDDVADNRVRVYFPGKPPAAIRARLKAAGFRWAPTIEAWQRHRSTAALYHARAVAEAFTTETGPGA